MPSIEFEVWCSCGAGLCNQTTDRLGGVIVEPCQNCSDKSYEEGYDRGYDEGYNEGYETRKEEEIL